MQWHVIWFDYIHIWTLFHFEKQVMQYYISMIAVQWYNILKSIIYYTWSFRVPNNIVRLCALLSVKYLGINEMAPTHHWHSDISVVSLSLSARMSCSRGRYVRAFSSIFNSWKFPRVRKTYCHYTQGNLKKPSDSKYSHWIAVNIVVTEFRHIEYLFLPLQTMMKAQMMMQMSAMQTPTVIPVIDFWSKW